MAKSTSTLDSAISAVFRDLECSLSRDLEHLHLSPGASLNSHAKRRIFPEGGAESAQCSVHRTQQRLLNSLPSGKRLPTKSKLCSPIMIRCSSWSEPTMQCASSENMINCEQDLAKGTSNMATTMTQSIPIGPMASSHYGQRACHHDPYRLPQNTPPHARLLAHASRYGTSLP